jgi:tetratricopeptide (TPR) repeat protein
MTLDTPERLRAEHARLAAALSAAPTAGERAAIKADIVTLFRRTEQLITELATFKEGIRELVEGFKSLPGEGAVSVRYDHIGATTYVDRGWSLLAASDWTAAATALREAATRDPGNRDARALLAWALARSGDGDGALALCRPLLEADASHGLARVAVGMVLVLREQFDDAMAHLVHVASSGDPRATLYGHYWLGVVALRRDDAPAAVESLRRAVSLGPNLGEGWAELGLALWHAGATADAREAWAVGSRIRHSPHAARCSELAALTATGGVPPRWPSL